MPKMLLTLQRYYKYHNVGDTPNNAYFLSSNCNSYLSNEYSNPSILRIMAIFHIYTPKNYPKSLGYTQAFKMFSISRQNGSWKGKDPVLQTTGLDF